MPGSLPSFENHDPELAPKPAHSDGDSDIAANSVPFDFPARKPAPTASNTAPEPASLALGAEVPAEVAPEATPETKKKGAFDVKELLEKGKDGLDKGLDTAKTWVGENKGLAMMGAGAVGLAAMMGLIALVKAKSGKSEKGRAGRGKREGRYARRALEEVDRGLVEEAFEDPEFLEFLEGLVESMDEME
jgi:hypothetical protein